MKIYFRFFFNTGLTSKVALFHEVCLYTITQNVSIFDEESVSFEKIPHKNCSEILCFTQQDNIIMLLFRIWVKSVMFLIEKKNEMALCNYTRGVSCDKCWYAHPFFIAIHNTRGQSHDSAVDDQRDQSAAVYVHGNHHGEWTGHSWTHHTEDRQEIGRGNKTRAYGNHTFCQLCRFSNTGIDRFGITAGLTFWGGGQMWYRNDVIMKWWLSLTSKRSKMTCFVRPRRPLRMFSASPTVILKWSILDNV